MTEIPLTQGLVALVDDEDAKTVLAHKWHAARVGRVIYAQRTALRSGRKVTIRLHTFLTGYGKTDHHNGDGLDNRRANLREATHAENQRNVRRPIHNTSGFKGVTLDKRSGKWTAQIHSSGRHLYLGRYTSPEDAARAYDDAAREHFGKYARVNFPSGETT